MPNSKRLARVTKDKRYFRLLYKVSRVLMLGCPLTLLVGCTSRPISYINVPPVPLPSDLLAASLPPLPAQPLTYGASVVWNEQLLTVIAQCNRDKAAIRQINNASFITNKMEK